MAESAESSIADRLRIFRESKRLTQAQMAEAVGGSTPGYKSNEQGTALPNSKLLIGLIGLGLNVDWLLTGDGPMLRDDVRKAVAPKINVEALAKAFEVMMQTAEAGETSAQTAKKAVDFYMYLLSSGMITTHGVGDGNLANAA